MDFLGTQYHPQKFDFQGNVRVKSDAADGWIIGGTSPSGEELGPIEGANYFIGAKYKEANFGAPQRIVWVPPRDGGERWVRNDLTGSVVSGSQVFSTGNFVEPDSDDTNYVFSRWATRVVPMMAQLWCHDFDDQDVLVQWLSTAIFATAPGAPESVGVPAIISGGQEEDEEMNERGLVYNLRCNFVFPVVRPPLRKERFQIEVSVQKVDQLP
jgi:hypothetical protein